MLIFNVVFNNDFRCFFYYFFDYIFFIILLALKLFFFIFFIFYFLICRQILFYFILLIFITILFFLPFCLFWLLIFFVSFQFLFFSPQKLTYFTMIMLGHHTEHCFVIWSVLNDLITARSTVVGSWEESPNTWLTVAKNAFVGWALNVRVRMLGVFNKYALAICHQNLMTCCRALSMLYHVTDQILVTFIKLPWSDIRHLTKLKPAATFILSVQQLNST